jgi:ferrous iron transport protein B
MEHIVKQTENTIPDSLLPLSELKAGEGATVAAVYSDEREIKKMAALGITQGVAVKVYKTGHPLLLDVAGTRVAIGLSTARKVMVEKAADKKKTPPHKTILLVGNPNVGKSQVFTRLTSVKAISSNFPGTTVEVKRAEALFNDFSCTIIDVPGIYRLENDNRAEQEASEIIKEQQYDLILYVLEATRLERSLFLALEILALNRPVLFLLNKYETAKSYGITIDAPKLSERLHVPVVATEALTGFGFKKLEQNIAQHINASGDNPADAHPPHTHRFAGMSDGSRWAAIGNIVEYAQNLEHRHPTWMERLADLCTRPATGLPIALLILAASFFLIRILGEGLINTLTPLYDNHYLPFLTGLFGTHTETWWGRLCLGDGQNTLGILTDALSIALIDVMSYVLIFYALFEFLADLGYLPRLAVLLDSMLHRLGIHGYGVIPILMGLGCKVPAVMSVRTLESRREKIIALLLIMMIAPCISQTGMIFNIFRGHSVFYLLLLFGLLALIGILAGFLLNKIMKGNPTEIFMEIPAWQWPRIAPWATKVSYRLKEYLVGAVPMIVLGVFLLNLLQQIDLLDHIADAMRFPVETLMGLPAETSPVVMLGFLRKDISISLLADYHLTPSQLLTACVFMTIALPCVATFFVTLKEFGIKTTAATMAFTFAVAFLLAVLLRLLL